MKKVTVDFSDAVSYRTLFLSALHLSVENRIALLDLADSQHGYYCHRTTNQTDTGIILRFGAIGGDFEDIAEILKGDGLDTNLIELLNVIHDEDYQAVHFDPDFDLLSSARWYTPDGCTVIPLAYNAALLSYYDLDAEQKKAVLSYLDENEDDASQNTYFIVEDIIYSLADFIQCGDNSDLADFGFTGAMGESNTSSIVVAVSDDQDSVDVARIF